MYETDEFWLVEKQGEKRKEKGKKRWLR